MTTLNLDLLFFDADPLHPMALVQVKASGGQRYAGEQYEDLIYNSGTDGT
jgi:hypothetical protein